MEVPYFGDNPGKRRREINLGGSTSAITHTSLLQDAKARRQQRNEVKHRQDSALKIQSWWRGRQQAAIVREQLKNTYEQNVTNLTGLRCLVLIDKDDALLAKWSTAVVSDGGASLSQVATDPSWAALLPRIAALLLRVVADQPTSANAPIHLKALDILLSSQSTSSSNPSRAILQSLLRNGYFALLGQAIRRIPVASKSIPSLPILVQFAVLPFSAFESSDEAYRTALEQLLIHILTIPLLPNRLPIAALTFLAPRIPLSFLYLIAPSTVVADLSTQDDSVNLLANLVAFAPPRYMALPVDSLIAYLTLTKEAMHSLPPQSLEPPEKSSQPVTWAMDDTDSEHETQVEVVTSFTSKHSLPQVDAKTRTRLQTLPSPQHLTSLLNATYHHSSSKIRGVLFSWLYALSTVWPSRRDKIVSTVVAWNGGGLVRELYRGYVRSSPLGKSTNPTTLTDESYAPHWPPLLFLVDLYNQALLTMGDEEFFSASQSASSSASSANISSRNPLTTDELTSFSRQLLNITFLLYWKEDQTNVQDGSIPGIPNMKWEIARERMTKLLQAIHARDSRRPFLSQDHWLMTSQLDIGPFVEAAIYEERQLSQPGARPLSKRQIALLSPRLGVLNHIPFAIPFDVRVSIFRSFINNDKAFRGIDGRWRGHPSTRVTVRRGSIAQDGFDRLQDYDLRSPIAITFIDQFGQEEAGIDGGGVFKEFLTSLCKEVFDTDRGLWLANKEHELYPNPHSYAKESHSLSWYRFIGRILGKALYDGILVDVAFAGFFLAKWLGKQSFLDDLATLDPELYNGLIFLKHYDGNPEDLSLNFAVALDEFGVTKTIPLIPNGDKIAVTKENRLRYIYLMSHYKLNRQIKEQSDAFFEGLSEIIDPKWLRMFNQQELQILLGGVDSPIDLGDLRAHTQYGGLYSDQEPTIQVFWRVVESFNHEQRRALLRFATSCGRPPLLGFKELNPNFAIRDAGSDESRLPTASTCVNLLKLPRYTSERTLRQKLVQAIQSNAGFDLS
ncbi:HECT-domain-containing protein [Irpex rosettiformis]|uniref:HECT-domain-containing protein n=1 Tax=Irpex rosettiformis TaxID=378272 RepID=A0ACB8U958_9APHY|nr:HECT-domain-containing protein [Irpex rosettiformis]